MLLSATRKLSPVSSVTHVNVEKIRMKLTATRYP